MNKWLCFLKAASHLLFPNSVSNPGVPDPGPAGASAALQPVLRGGHCLPVSQLLQQPRRERPAELPGPAGHARWGVLLACVWMHSSGFWSSGRCLCPLRRGYSCVDATGVWLMFPICTDHSLVLMFLWLTEARARYVGRDEHAFVSHGHVSLSKWDLKS